LSLFTCPLSKQDIFLTILILIVRSLNAQYIKHEWLVSHKQSLCWLQRQDTEIDRTNLDQII